MLKIIEAPKSGIMPIGKQGENLVTRVSFKLPPDWDMSDPAASMQLIVLRAGETTAYPVMLTLGEDGMYCWDVTATDTACRGYNQCELRYMRGEVIAKSMTWATHVSEAIDADLTDPPEGSENYLSRVMAVGAKAVDAAGRSERSATQADDALRQIKPAADQVISDIRTEGDTQVQRVSDEGAAQIKEATRQAEIASEAAGNAAGSADVSRDAADRAEAAAIRQPYPDENTGTWWCWDTDVGAYTDSGIDARGVSGQVGIMTVEGAEVALTLANNVETRCADPVTALTIDGFAPGEDGRAEQWGLVFTASADGITVTVPDSLVWAVAEPVFTAGATYWLSVVPIGSNYLAAWTEVSNESESA